jgi:hypothetical protein
VSVEATRAIADRAALEHALEQLSKCVFSSNVERAEAFEALRERVDDEAPESDALLFDLALAEAHAHRDARADAALSGEEADVLLSSLARVVAGQVVEGREDRHRSAVEALAEALADRRLDGSPEVSTSVWLTLARAALRRDDGPLVRRALASYHRACAGARGAAAAQAAWTALELASYADDGDAASDAADRLWALREHEELDVEDRASLVAPVWQVRMALGDAAAAREAAEALVGLCQQSGSERRVAEALAAVAECARAEGDLHGARRALTKRLEIAERLLEQAPDDVFSLARRDEARACLAALEDEITASLRADERSE